MTRPLHCDPYRPLCPACQAEYERRVRVSQSKLGRGRDYVSQSIKEVERRYAKKRK